MYEQKGKNYYDDDDDDDDDDDYYYTTLRNLVYKIIKRGRYSETEKKKKKILQQMNTIGIIFWCGINYRVAIVRSSASSAESIVCGPIRTCVG